MEVTSLLDNAICNMQKAHYCLFGILPAENEHEHEIRKRGHNYLRQGGNVFARLCLFVCLSVCLSVC